MFSKRHMLLQIVLLAAIAAVVVFLSMQDAAPPEEVGKRTLPELEGRLNDVRLIVVSRGDEEVKVFQDTDNVWKVQQLESYPADLTKVRRVLYRLEQSRLLETKTNNPKRLGRLMLDDAYGHVLRLMTRDDSGYQPLSDIIIGKLAPDFKGTYLRYYEDPQSWLATEQIEVKADPLKWVDPIMLNVPRSRVKSVEILHTGADVLTITRDKPGADFEILGKPEDKAVESNYQVNIIASAMEMMRLSDVAAASKVKLPKTQLLVTFKTFDGMEVYFDIGSENDTEYSWAKAYAAYNPDLVPVPSEDTEEAQKKAEEQAVAVMAEVDAINARLSGWLYKIASHHQALLKKKMDDLVKAKPSTSNTPPQK